MSEAESSESYDVFINFRGEDTRINLTSHLISGLENKNIKTYTDYKLDGGEDIWPALEKAIESSHIAILVFSPNYANSKWCLEELVKIMECREHKGQVVLPVFYQINPSDVRKQGGSFEKAFAQHVQDLSNNKTHKDKVDKWKNALKRAATISGWDFQSRIHRDDAHFVQNIVNDVWQKLHQRFPGELKGIVGIEDTCEYMELLLRRVRKIGIWGMGGIGKTTIAKALFAKQFPHYDSVCLLENVRVNSEMFGLATLRHKLVSELLKEESPLSNVIGSTFIMERLKSKRVFIVLDDVDSLEQLECLCGQPGDLGEDSTLIITTRDRHLLSGRVDGIYEVKERGNKESRELFCSYAFRQRYPLKGYEDLVDMAVHYAGGIPLALKILGSLLFTRDRPFWEDTLSKLKKYPNEHILKVLKLSYDGLDPLQKKIFLDIAFFFNLKRKDDVIRILEACGFYANEGIKILEDRALITIVYNVQIKMHDLLIEMGLEIVRKDYKENPERHSRLTSKAAYDVLQNNKGTDAVEGILLDLSQIGHLHLSADTFNKMSKLRFLQFYVPSGEKSCVVFKHVNLNAFPYELRYLEWNGYPFKCFPPNFCSKFLVEVRMPHSNIKKLWQGTQDLVNLVFIDLRECKQLMELPDFSSASKLETLLLNGCKRLKSLKTEKHFSFLEHLNVDGCSSLKEFSLSSDLIVSLDLSTTGVKILHPTLGRLSRLARLNLEGLRLETLPDELSTLSSLTELGISHCRHVINKQKLHVLCDGTLSSLGRLHLKSCCKLFELPDNISTLSSLFELRLDGSSVERLPASIKQLKELRILSLEDCRKLRSLPELPPGITRFNAVNCRSLVTVSTLKTFSAQMKGNQKHISFMNATKLDENSLHSIMEDTEHTILSAAFHNAIGRLIYDTVGKHNHNYNKVRGCFPGRSVPRWFPNQNKKSSITIEPPMESYETQGFIFCVVVSPSRGRKKQHGAHIQCKCRNENGEMIGYTSEWHYEVIQEELNSDHVFLWYDPDQSDNLIFRTQESVCFEFCVTNESREPDGLISIKECGVRLIRSSESEFYGFLRNFDLELKSKVELGLKFGLAVNRKWGSLRRRQTLYLRLENEEELDKSQKQLLESYRHEILTAIERVNNDTTICLQNHERDLGERPIQFWDYIVVFLPAGLLWYLWRSFRS